MPSVRGSQEYTSDKAIGTVTNVTIRHARPGQYSSDHFRRRHGVALHIDARSHGKHFDPEHTKGIGLPADLSACKARPP
jgi:hypothetical protein